MSERLLPEQFAGLESWVGEWSLPTEEKRYRRRLSLPLDEVKAFYDALLPHMDDIMKHLQGFRGDNPEVVPVQTRNLFYLALAFMDATHPVELRWKSTDLNDAFPASRIEYHPPSSMS